MQPKTALGQRAMAEHLAGLGAINPQDPDTNWALLQMFGGTKLSPTLNIHMQAALRKQQNFEEWALDKQAQSLSAMQQQGAVQQYEQALVMVPNTPMPTDPATGQVPSPELPQPPSVTQFTPLAWKPWYNPAIHRQEFMKWTNSDKMVELLKQNPALEPLLVAHLMDIENALAVIQAAMAPTGPNGSHAPNAQGPKGSAVAAKNSNSESGGSQNASDHTAQPQGNI